MSRDFSVNGNLCISFSLKDSVIFSGVGTKPACFLTPGGSDHLFVNVFGTRPHCDFDDISIRFSSLVRHNFGEH